MANEPVTPTSAVPAAPTPDSPQVSATPAPAAPAAPAQPVSATAQPQVPQAPATPGSPDALQTADKRIKDAQQRMHEATTEASQLRAQLTAILNHPLLGPVAKTVAQTPQQPQPDDTVDKAWKEYQSAPDDKTAFAKLLEAAEERTYRRLRREAEEAKMQRQNAERTKQRDMLLAQHITKTVQETAPDVPLDLFWAMAERAEAETPVTLQTLPERIEWQVGRAVELSRGLLKPNSQQTNQTTATQVQQPAQAVMPGGGAGPAATTPSQPGQYPTLVEQIKAAQSRKVEKV